MGTAFAKSARRTGPTPQSKPIPGREAEMVRNDAGGYVFRVGDWEQLDRFLILGSEGGTYYTTEQKLTRDNAGVIMRCLAADGLRLVARVVEISDGGRAPKNDPALFALAMAAAATRDGKPDAQVRGAALAALPKVARIGTHLFHFTEFVDGQRGWGRGLRHALSAWYLDRPADKLAEQVTKYQGRDGWSHRDVLRLSHPKVNSAEHRAVIDWAVHGRKDDQTYPLPILGFELAKAAAAAGNLGDIAHIIRVNRLPRECVPTEALNLPSVWEALLEGMPITAMIRNLAKMTSIGLIAPGSAAAKTVIERLDSTDLLQRGRVHPIAIFLALKTYAAGHGVRGKLTWSPVPRVIDALSEAFYLAMKGVRPTGKRVLIAVDSSGSMTGGLVAGIENVRPVEAAAAVASVFLRTEQACDVIGYDTSVWETTASPRQRLDDLARSVNRSGGGTNADAVYTHLINKKAAYDAVVMITDNETWAGHRHATQGLKAYRNAIGLPVKFVGLGMTPTNSTVVDGADPLQLGAVGLDASVPDIVSGFIAG